MKQLEYLCLFLGFIHLCHLGKCQEVEEDEKEPLPNIVIIMADDLGFNDVSLHGSNQFYTPNIDSLGYQGLVLNSYYSPFLSSGARASFFTGKYPSRLGLQEASLANDESAGLGQNEKLMPQYFKEAGYKTHLVGKWHLGFHQEILTPKKRGFDHHFGPWGGKIDYFDYTHRMPGGTRGLDMRNDTEVFQEIPGRYATRLFGEKAREIVLEHNFDDEPLFLVVSHIAPGVNGDGDLQAPADSVEKLQHIRNYKRRLFAAMTQVLDEEIGQLIDTLDSRGILNNTVIVFISDNGGMAEGHMSNTASNYPLRGQKMGPFEGGVRAVATVWSPLIQSRHRISQQLMHAADWLPTLAAVASIEMPTELDGINLWPALSSNMPSPRTDILHTSNPTTETIVYLTDGWKFISTKYPAFTHTEWMGLVPENETQTTPSSYFAALNASKTWQSLNIFAESVLDEAQIVFLRSEGTISCGRTNDSLECNPNTMVCLFNIPSDPCEMRNLATVYPEIITQIRNQLNQQPPSMFPINVPGNARSDPRNFNYTWTFWSDVILANEKFTEL